MPQHDGNKSDWLTDTRKGFDTAHALCQVLAFPVTLCATRFGTWGSNYLGPSAVLGLFWPLLLAAFFGPDPRAVDLARFWVLSVGLLLIHRVAGLVRRHRGYRCHSRYWGTSWLARGDGLKAQKAARLGESLVALLVGLVCHAAASKPLGVLFLVGGVAKLMSDAIEFQAVAARLRQTDDARIENDYFLALARERAGGR